MTELEIINQIKGLESDMLSALNMEAFEFYQDLLNDCTKLYWALRFAKSDYPDQRTLEIGEEIGQTDDDFDRFTLLNDLLAVLLYQFSEKELQQCLRQQ